MNVRDLASDHEALALILLFLFGVIAFVSVVFVLIAVLNKGNGKRNRDSSSAYARFIKSLMPW